MTLPHAENHKSLHSLGCCKTMCTLHLSRNGGVCSFTVPASLLVISERVVKWAAYPGEQVELGNAQQINYPTSREDCIRFVVLLMDHDGLA